MTRVAFVAGRYGPYRDACVRIDDRGLQFADSVYEVVPVRGAQALNVSAHLERLTRSLSALDMPAPMSERALLHTIKEVVRRNRLREGLVYLQVTRGATKRGHVYPVNPGLDPTLVIAAYPRRSQPSAAGVAVITLRDERWARCDIKSTGLLPNVLAKVAAAKMGAFEAWLLDDHGRITEGASSNAWIVDADGRLVTRGLDGRILPGVTRATLIKLARAHGVEVVERAFSLEEALVAREAFLTSAGAAVTAVIAIDGHPLHDGAPGPVTKRLAALYGEAAVGG